MRTLLFLLLLIVSLIDTGYAQDNYSSVISTGIRNFADIEQTGDQHHSTVYQNGNNSILQKNLADVKQENIGTLSSNESSIQQFGRGHESKVRQKGDNLIEVRIGESSAPNLSNTTYGDQRGESNEAYQDILGSDARNTKFDVRQFIGQNLANQEATNARYSLGEGKQNGILNILEQRLEGFENHVKVDQVGNENESYQWIRGYNSGNNFSNIAQYGDENYTAIRTEGNANSFEVTQSGNLNRVYGSDLLMPGAGTQQGDENFVLVFQLGESNEVHLTQQGDGNRITGPESDALGATQIGKFNEIEISQSGDLNISRSLQTSDHNSGGVFQTGQSHLSVLRQNGNENAATIIQNN